MKGRGGEGGKEKEGRDGMSGEVEARHRRRRKVHDSYLICSLMMLK